MKTWRERIAEARQRGEFTRDDKVSIMSFERCMIGEVANGLFGPKWQDLRIATDLKWLGLNEMPDERLGNPFNPLNSVCDDDLDSAEKALDYIEDRALQLKREQRDV